MVVISALAFAAGMGFTALAVIGSAYNEFQGWSSVRLVEAGGIVGGAILFALLGGILFTLTEISRKLPEPARQALSRSGDAPAAL